MWCRGAQLCAPTRQADALTFTSDSVSSMSFEYALNRTAGDSYTHVLKPECRSVRYARENSGEQGSRARSARYGKCTNLMHLGLERIAIAFSRWVRLAPAKSPALRAPPFVKGGIEGGFSRRDSRTKKIWVNPFENRSKRVRSEKHATDMTSQIPGKSNLSFLNLQ